MNLNKQIRRLLLLDGLSNLHLAGTAWVLLLTPRGFTLTQIGLAEGVFHLVSLCCELPSGMLADLLGRKWTLAASRAMGALSALAMCLAMGLCALGYNLASGTREAITYDSLLQCGQAERYLRVSAWQNIFWRGAGAAALLGAGLTAALGYRLAYGLDILVDALAVLTALGLTEPAVGAPERRPRLSELPRGFRDCARDAADFLRANPAAAAVMLFNALVGALATLLGFFLQDGLTSAGAGNALLGPLLLLVALGGVAGSRAALLLERLPYRLTGLLCLAGVAAGAALSLTGRLPLLAAGGLLASACDDAFQMLTDARLNAMIPSQRRATLISVSSMTFSLVMIVLSPLTGAVWEGLL